MASPEIILAAAEAGHIVTAAAGTHVGTHGATHHEAPGLLDIIRNNLPALQVLVPLTLAPLITLLNNRNLSWLLAMVGTSVSLLIAVVLTTQVLDGSVISYALGNWAPPLGIELRVDAANALVLLIVAAIGTCAAIYARPSVDKELGMTEQPLFYTAFLLCFSGLLGVTITGDAFNLFVFLEISSLSTYALVAMGAKQDRRALNAAYNYLILGTVGATFYVIGLGLAYMMTGTLNMADLAQRLPDLMGSGTLWVAFGFITIGLATKLAMFPLHFWLPNAYTYAPSVVTGFLAATATKVAVYALIRFIFTVFGADFAVEAQLFGKVLLPLGLIGIIAGSLVAIWQVNAKRILAFSSVAQIGYMLVGLGLMSLTGLTATMLHMFNHALMKGALFFALGAVMWKLGGVTLDKMRGAGKLMPWTMAAFVGGGLSLVGVPTTVGFISKWYLLNAAFEREWYWLIAILLITSLMAAVYMWRVFEVAYLRPAPEGVQKGEAPLLLLIPTWALVLANFWFGLNATTTVNLAETAARGLLGLTGGAN